MSVISVTTSEVCGTVAAPPSKSLAHRALIAAALTGNSQIKGILPSDDMKATLRCLEALGKPSSIEGDTVTFSGNGQVGAIADCGESGSTLRFFIPIFAALGIEVTFIGKGRLPTRPLTTFEECLPKHDVKMTKTDISGGIVHISGKLSAGRFFVAGNVSSQFITGLLFALPLLKDDSEIILTSPLQSADYVELTLQVLEQAGIEIVKIENGFYVRGSQAYSLNDYTVEGDWSQAAFLLTAGAIGGDVTVTGLRKDSIQGDKRIEELLRQMGADITWSKAGLRSKKAPLKAVDIDVSDIPDLLPILSVAAASADGRTRLYNAARLRLKESDRLSTTFAMITALGGKAEEFNDELCVIGSALSGGTVEGANDHRIVMSATVASLLTKNAVTVTDSHSINKSWPSFFDDYKLIGGNIYELSDR